MPLLLSLPTIDAIMDDLISSFLPNGNNNNTKCGQYDSISISLL